MNKLTKVEIEQIASRHSEFDTAKNRMTFSHRGWVEFVSDLEKATELGIPVLLGFIGAQVEIEESAMKAEKEALFDAMLNFISDNMGKEEEYGGRMETWCYFCGAYQDPKEGISHAPGCLFSWVQDYIAEQNDPDPEMKDFLDDKDQETSLAHGLG